MLSINLKKTNIFKYLSSSNQININYQTINDSFNILHVRIINDYDLHLMSDYKCTKRTILVLIFYR